MAAVGAGGVKIVFVAYKNKGVTSNGEIAVNFNADVVFFVVGYAYFFKRWGVFLGIINPISRKEIVAHVF